jgi:chromosomal replication initiator protein
MNWIHPISAEVGADGVFQLEVPDEATRVVVQEDYTELISITARNLGIFFQGIEIRTRLETTTPASHARAGATAGGSMMVGGIHPRADYGIGLPSTASLIDRYTFENFVVGSCNQFAHAACRAVASKPAGSYNPLFLYGGTGVGKTHLMHAIGLALSRTDRSPRIVYTSSERFVNDMVTCIKQERMPAFHAHYRSADILLIDDIHIIAGKERTQEEFFHTFNELYEHKKQIVISSDSAPKQIPGLVERLRSRFEWGLMVDMQPPDLETKMAILDKKAEAEGVPLPEDVRIYIATHTKSNVRELEGALVKVLAWASINRAPITLSLAKRILTGLDDRSERKVSIDAIQKAVAARFKLQQHQLRQRTNVRAIAYPRQVAMYLAKDLTTASLTEIGRAFGGKHHTTVLHSINKITEEMASDPEANKLIHSLINSLK